MRPSLGNITQVTRADSRTRTSPCLPWGVWTTTHLPTLSSPRHLAFSASFSCISLLQVTAVIVSTLLIVRSPVRLPADTHADPAAFSILFLLRTEAH